MIEKRLEESLILRLIALGERLKRRRDIISQSLGISTQQWLILLHLAQDPNIPFFEKKRQRKPLLASEIADSLEVSRPNITNMLNTLLEKKLIKQVADGNDRRRKRLELSEKGWELVRSLQPSRQFFNEMLFADFTHEQKEQLLGMVDKCIEQLEAYQSEQHETL